MSEVQIPSEVEALAAQSVQAALAVHRTLGPGLLESAYQECLALELRAAGVHVDREVGLPFTYRGHAIDSGYRVDLIVGHRLLIELKAVESLAPIHRAQVITYLKLLDVPLGLLINFNVPLIKDGIHRVLNLQHGTRSGTLQPSPSAIAPSRPCCSAQR